MILIKMTSYIFSILTGYLNIKRIFKDETHNDVFKDYDIYNHLYVGIYSEGLSLITISIHPMVEVGDLPKWLLREFSRKFSDCELPNPQGVRLLVS